MSLPTRECGLKFLGKIPSHSQPQVTPYAGVWIEISNRVIMRNPFMSLPTRECGLKCRYTCKNVRSARSLPTRECGLKSANLSDTMHI